MHRISIVTAMAVIAAIGPAMGQEVINGYRVYVDRGSDPTVPVASRTAVYTAGGKLKTRANGEAAKSVAYTDSDITGSAGSLSDGDKGDFTCTSGICVTDNGSIGVADLASVDFGAFTCNGSACSLDVAYQAADSDLTTYAGITPSENVQTFLGAADYAAMRTQLGLVIGTNVQAYDADLTTWAGITPGSGVGTFLATPSSANLASAVTGETGTGALVFGTDPVFSTSVQIPNGTGPTVDAAGEIAVDTTTDQLQFYGGAKRALPSIQFSSLVIAAPADTDDINILKAPYAMTILGISCIVQGTTSITGQLQECATDGTSCADLDSDITCDADGAADDGTLTDSAIASGAWLRWKTTSVSGTPTFATITLRYRVVAD